MLRQKIVKLDNNKEIETYAFTLVEKAHKIEMEHIIKYLTKAVTEDDELNAEFRKINPYLKKDGRDTFSALYGLIYNLMSQANRDIFIKALPDTDKNKIFKEFNKDLYVPLNRNFYVKEGEFTYGNDNWRALIKDAKYTYKQMLFAVKVLTKLNITTLHKSDAKLHYNARTKEMMRFMSELELNPVDMWNFSCIEKHSYTELATILLEIQNISYKKEKDLVAVLQNKKYKKAIETLSYNNDNLNFIMSKAKDIIVAKLDTPNLVFSDYFKNHKDYCLKEMTYNIFKKSCNYKVTFKDNSQEFTLDAQKGYFIDFTFEDKDGRKTYKNDFAKLSVAEKTNPYQRSLDVINDYNEQFSSLFRCKRAFGINTGENGRYYSAFHLLNRSSRAAFMNHIDYEELDFDAMAVNTIFMAETGSKYNRPDNFLLSNYVYNKKPNIESIPESWNILKKIDVYTDFLFSLFYKQYNLSTVTKAEIAVYRELSKKFIMSIFGTQKDLTGEKSIRNVLRTYGLLLSHDNSVPFSYFGFNGENSLGQTESEAIKNLIKSAKCKPILECPNSAFLEFSKESLIKKGFSPKEPIRVIPMDVNSIMRAFREVLEPISMHFFEATNSWTQNIESRIITEMWEHAVNNNVLMLTVHDAVYVPKNKAQFYDSMKEDLFNVYCQTYFKGNKRIFEEFSEEIKQYFYPILKGYSIKKGLDNQTLFTTLTYSELKESIFASDFDSYSNFCIHEQEFIKLLRNKYYYKEINKKKYSLENDNNDNELDSFESYTLNQLDNNDPLNKAILEGLSFKNDKTTEKYSKSDFIYGKNYIKSFKDSILNSNIIYKSIDIRKCSEKEYNSYKITEDFKNISETLFFTNSSIDTIFNYYKNFKKITDIYSLSEFSLNSKEITVSNDIVQDNNNTITNIYPNFTDSIKSSDNQKSLNNTINSTIQTPDTFLADYVRSLFCPKIQQSPVPKNNNPQKLYKLENNIKSSINKPRNNNQLYIINARDKVSPPG